MLCDILFVSVGHSIASMLVEVSRYMDKFLVVLRREDEPRYSESTSPALETFGMHPLRLSNSWTSVLGLERMMLVGTIVQEPGKNCCHTIVPICA